VHRIGRTGRAGEKGVAHTFFTNVDRSKAHELVKIMQGAKQEVPAELAAMAARAGSGGECFKAPEWKPPYAFKPPIALGTLRKIRNEFEARDEDPYSL
jgi:superfamily II DNA/RNA helicase